VKKFVWLSLIFISMAGVLLLSIRHEQPPNARSPVVLPSPEQDIRYQAYTMGQSVVHTLFVPVSDRFLVTPAIFPQLGTLETYAQKYQAVAGINGGFFDPQNRKSTSIVVKNGLLVADPRQNARLMNNPQLAPYLSKILNRTEFRRYRCDRTIRYDITLHSAPSPPGCQLVDALGGGPRLLPEQTLVQEGFLDFANGRVIRDSLASRQPNARSAIGISRDGNIILAMVAQQPEASTKSGMSLQSLTAFMQTLGVEKAMNLDGGSSSAFYYKGKTFYGKVNEKGNLVKRQVLSVLLILEN
jgi:hypothetical protein